MRRAVAATALVLLLGLVVLVLRSGPGTSHVTAVFPATVGVYEGSEVRLMGVPIGTVTRITPQGTNVEVEMEYDATYDLPADAGAVIIAPSLVSDRFVQLTPAYGGGERLAEGAVIPRERTVVPIELDEAFSTANDLLVALGPDGANSDGAFNRFLDVSADNLDGQGPQLRSLLDQFSGASTTLGDTSAGTFATIRHLDRFTRALAGHDGQIRTFNDQMASVASFLAGEQDELSTTLVQLAQTFADVEDFVRTNRDVFTANVDHLVRISDALANERVALESLQRVMPVGLNNLNRTFDERNQGVRSRTGLDQVAKDLDGALCTAIAKSGIPRPNEVCRRFAQLLAGMG